MARFSGHESEDFNCLKLVEFLVEDLRPTFAITLVPASVPSDHQLQLVFSNQAFHRIGHRLNGLTKCSTSSYLLDGTDADTIAFTSWINSNSDGKCYEFCDLTWTAVTLHQKWRIVSSSISTAEVSGQCDDGEGLHDDRHAPKAQAGETGSGTTSSLMTRPSEKQDTYLPSTKHIENSGLIQCLGANPSAHDRSVQCFDWGGTPLGPMLEWSQDLLQAVSYLLSSPEPCCMFWGSDRTLVYNEPCISLIKNLHPAAMGSSARSVFESLWSPFEAICLEIERTAQPVRHENVCVPLDRSGQLEEAFFTYNLVPIIDKDNGVCGIFNHVVEVTSQIVAQRQLRTLRSIGEGTALMTSLARFWQGLFASTEACIADLPFMAVFSMGEATANYSLSSGTRVSDTNDDIWHLEGSNGFPSSLVETQKRLILSRNEGFAPVIQLALSQPGPLLVEKGDGTLATELFPSRSNDHVTLTASQIVVCQLHLSLTKTVLILALNPLRPYDENYRDFLNLLSRQIEDAATSVILLEKEKYQLQQTVEQAEHQRRSLSEQLLLQTREAQESALRFMNFARQAPIGVYIFGSEGEIKFCNDAWYRQVGVPTGSTVSTPWRAQVHPDDLEAVDRQWKLLQKGHVQAGFELRILRTPRTGNDNEDIRYMQSSAFPELADDGSMKSVTGILLDLSVDKAHERAVAEKLASALEAKRSQENFMDMVSHEMRNPLNAILQCAEEAAQSVQAFASGHTADESPSTIAEQVLEAVDTILYCGYHQKQIIDDVLTISKLDSNLLTLSPTSVKPTAVVEQTVKIFSSEIRASAINVNWSQVSDGATSPATAIFMDQSRVLQILINLVGNAVKFLKGRSVRRLSITAGTTITKPRNSRVQYVPSGKKRESAMMKADWGNGDEIYIQFAVTDTGPGLTPEQMRILFARFTQASPRTHGQYGGSGLGLFISRELAELHGGEIGLASELHHGSTFAFYVKGRVDISFVTNTAACAAISASANGNIPSLSYADLVLCPADVTILIVEDNLINQKVLGRQLRKLGFKTETANDGEQALSMVQRSRWWYVRQERSVNLSIILCDLEMPVMDGTTCVRQLRQWQSIGLLHDYVPVIAVTGNARPEQVRAAREAGFDDVVCKPYSVPDLVPVVSKLLQAGKDAKHTTVSP